MKCHQAHSNFINDTYINRKFSELELQCENLSHQINTIVKSIISHKKIINELELEIADLIISQSLSTPHSSSPARVTESYSSAPPSKSVPSSDCVPASSSAPPSLSASPFPSAPPPRSVPPSCAAPASRSAPPSPSAPLPFCPLSPSAPPSRSAPPPVVPVPLTLPLVGVLLLLCLHLPPPDILPH